jgi:hypothetical protein
MRTTSVMVSAAVIALVALAPLADAAGQSRRSSGDRGRGQAVARSAPRQSGARPPAQAARGEQRSGPQRAPGAPYSAAVPRRAAPPAYGNTRFHSYGASRYARPYYGRSYYGRPYYPAYGRPYGYPYYAHGYRYAHPYYAFRPRLHVGFGVWVGFPVSFPVGFYASYSTAYPYPYSYPYPYAAPYPAYGYPVAPAGSWAGAVSAAPATPTVGGVSFEITPSNAAVFVDGTYVGEASDFGPNAPPLTLTPGPHRVQVEAPGYEPWISDITITAGQVIPYRGNLLPLAVP